MITVLAAVVEGVCYAIVFTKMKYQFRVNNEVLCEDTDYQNVRAEFITAVGF